MQGPAQPLPLPSFLAPTLDPWEQHCEQGLSSPTPKPSFPRTLGRADTVTQRPPSEPVSFILILPSGMSISESFPDKSSFHLHRTSWDESGGGWEGHGGWGDSRFPILALIIKTDCTETSGWPRFPLQSLAQVEKRGSCRFGLARPREKPPGEAPAPSSCSETSPKKEPWTPGGKLSHCLTRRPHGPFTLPHLPTKTEL